MTTLDAVFKARFHFCGGLLTAGEAQIRPDGAFRDEFTIERGYWEAKDTDDDLAAEIKKKIKRGCRSGAAPRYSAS